MIGYFLLFQFFATTAGKPSFNLRDDILGKVVKNDANLNPGFDLEAFRQGQLDLHNYYREKHGVSQMTLASAYDEIWDYNFCTGGRRPGHEGKDIGHFTQVVWKTSTKLGIGYARTADRKKVYVFGRYLDGGNVPGQYFGNVVKPSYILDTFQDNCDGIDGGLTPWSAAGQCSRSCGGGVKFKTKTCTNPKPSLNGRDCPSYEPTKEIVVQEWCNTQVINSK